MDQEKTQCNMVVIPSMDQVSVGAQGGCIAITQRSAFDGAEDVIWIHPMFADAVCAAIMRAAKEARPE